MASFVSSCMCGHDELDAIAARVERIAPIVCPHRQDAGERRRAVARALVETHNAACEVFRRLAQ